MLTEIKEEKILFIYNTMLKIRRFEEKAKELFQKNLIRGGVHLYIGEEAVASGACAAIKESDYITSTHRGHGHCIAKGGDLKLMMAELMGKSTGYCKGKGGSMHIADIERGILGANGIVGGGVPIATGAALSSLLSKSDRVVLCFFGDGAVNQGSFHESLNIASLWRLPVIYICENNKYAVSTTLKESLSVENVADRAKAYNILGIIVDGNDAIEVYRLVSKAVSGARDGKGPSLIEANTYRWEGHFIGDPSTYRSKDELEEWKKKDPILRMKDYLITSGIADNKVFEKMESDIDSQIKEAIEFAMNSPEPDESELLIDVYS